MKESYTQTELDQVLSRVQKRSGWDFSRMNDSRAPVPWDYHDVVLRYLTRQATVLDIGTGGGESFLELAGFFDAGLGVDIDPEMIERAVRMGKIRRMWSLLSLRKLWTRCRKASMSLSTATRHLI